MSNQLMILYVIAGVMLVLYLIRRRKRLTRDDD